MRYKNSYSATRQKIILEIFKLFTSKPLAEITFADIEKATGLSRGGILHYFGTKDQLYMEMMEHFIYKRDDEIPFDPQKNMWDNIKEFINHKREQQEYFTNMGISNISRAHTYMAINIMEIVDNFETKATVWLEKELDYWRKLLNLAQQKGEIKKNVNIDIVARLFSNVFLGNSYISTTTSNGYNLDNIQEQFYVLYTEIVNQ